MVTNAALEQELKELKMVLKVLPGFIYWKDKDGNFLGGNLNEARVHGYEDSDALVGKTDKDLVPAEYLSRIEANDHYVLSKRLELIVEETGKTAQGDEAVFLSTKLPLIVDGNLCGTVGVSIDITERKRIEKELRIEINKSEAANRAKAAFIANLSHDIRTPLTGMLGLIEEICDLSDKHPLIAQHADTLGSCTREFFHFFNQILESADLSDGKSSYPDQHFNIQELVNHTLSLIQPATQHKGMALHLEIASDMPLVFYAKHVLLSRILLNLCGNAVKFTHQGHIIIRINFVSKTKSVQISVEDTGIGIAPQDHEAIFERFTRLTASSSGQYPGSGLGLYAVKQYVKILSGHIHVESALGKGCCFTIDLPLPLGNPEKITPHDNQTDRCLPIEEQLGRINPLSHLPNNTQLEVPAHVLVVEDNILAAQMVKRMLTKLDCRVDIAETGERALQLVGKRTYDLILMDVGLPDQPGTAITTTIRTRETQNQSVPIVALSGHISAEDRERCLKSGMQEMLTKPLTPSVLQQVLRLYVQEDQEMTASILPDENEHLQVIDQSLHRSLYGDNHPLVCEMLSHFYQELDNDLSKMQKAIDQHAYQDLTQIIHKFHGGLVYCGLPRLQSAVEKLQTLAHEKPMLPKNLLSAMKRLAHEASRFKAVYEKEYVTSNHDMHNLADSR